MNELQNDIRLLNNKLAQAHKELAQLQHKKARFL